VIILREESLGTVCTLTREKARSECRRLADQPARSVKTSQRGDSCDAVCRIGTYTAFTGCEILHASQFLTLFTADKNLLKKITLQTSPQFTRLIGFLNIHHIKAYKKFAKIKGYNIPKYSTIKFIR
jgi:hypothetical protein